MQSTELKRTSLVHIIVCLHLYSKTCLQTRILVTHGLVYLPYVDYIYVMKDGEIAEAGTYHELLEQNNNFAEFIRTYANEEQNTNSNDEGK